MIVSEKIDATANAFRRVLNKSIAILKADAAKDAKTYIASSGTKLEGLVLRALETSARKTEFEGSIRLASGQKFPDIVLMSGGMGVEVKSTTQNHWVTTGNSVRESTRLPDIKKVFLMFGKLAEPIDFKVRPYEECLKEVLVTHYPRYQIDMNLEAGQTIFDKIGKSYDEVRQLAEPATPMIEYYSSKLRKGESLWWSKNSNVEEQSSPLTVRELNLIDEDEQMNLIADTFILFPQLFGNSTDKFHEILMWFLRKGVICGNIRDFYSAGGKWHLGAIAVPQVIKRFYENRNNFFMRIQEMDSRELNEAWKVKIPSSCNRILFWLELVSNYIKDQAVYKVLKDIVLSNYQTGCAWVIKNASTEVLLAAHKSTVGFDAD